MGADKLPLLFSGEGLALGVLVGAREKTLEVVSKLLVHASQKHSGRFALQCTHSSRTCST